MEDNYDRTRRVVNSLVSGSFKIGSPEDLKTIQKLVVKTGSTGIRTSSVVASDVWHYFGPLYGECNQIYINFPKTHELQI